MKRRASSVLCGTVALSLALGVVPMAALAEGVTEPDTAGGAQSGGSKMVAADELVEEDAIAGTGESNESPAPDQLSDLADSALPLVDSEITARPSEEVMTKVMADLDEVTPSTFSADREQRMVQEFSGADRYEVSSMVARAAFPDGCSTAIIAGGEGWADALGATSLAGALDCPILLTNQGFLNSGTKSTLASLGVKSVIIVGGPDTVSKAVESELAAAGISVTTRLGGADRYDVQMAIYNYGEDLWTSDYVIVASGSAFGDALSASPLAYSKRVPVFLADGSGSLSASQKSALEGHARSGRMRQCLVVGGPRSVSDATLSYLEGVASRLAGGSALRLGGADRYEVSAGFASWAVENGLLAWDGAAFTTGEKPYDALSGSALQGKMSSVMLLLSGSDSPAVSKFVSSGSDSVKFFGGTDSVPASWRSEILAQMYSVVTYDTGITLSKMADLESAASSRYDRAQILEYLDPFNFSYGSTSFYQFADVSKGYSGRVSAQQIDAFIDGMCSRYGYTKSTLGGMGSTIVDAARNHGVNEVYLLSHAILESGWGMSSLAQGEVEGYEGYYNFFGIGAFDADPNNGGAYLAKAKGWDTPEKAIDGAAQWISANYVHSTYGQNTLYKMRWNPKVMWHQYATNRKWADGIGRVMGQAYAYFGLEASETGLTFQLPIYR